MVYYLHEYSQIQVLAFSIDQHLVYYYSFKSCVKLLFFLIARAIFLLDDFTGEIIFIPFNIYKLNYYLFPSQSYFICKNDMNYRSIVLLILCYSNSNASGRNVYK